MRFIIRLVDQILSRVYLKIFQEKNSLILFYFHGLFRNEKDISLNLVNPQSQRGFTINHLRQFVEYFLSHNYTFISPDDILSGLNYDKKYIMVTFDDGYFSNQYALPVLKEYKITAVFFISTNHIIYNTCFWWDVLYRERAKRGISRKKISREMEYLKSKTSVEIEKYIMDTFSKEAFKPVSDIDRPFTPSELKDFSKEKYVVIGNHTSDHAILTNYTPSGIKSQIQDAQNSIYDITRITPVIIAYPNGMYSDEVVKISKQAGLKLGLTINPQKNYLPISLQGDGFMRLNRFPFQGNNTLRSQCEVARSDISLYNTIKSLWLTIL